MAALGRSVPSGGIRARRVPEQHCQAMPGPVLLPQGCHSLGCGCWGLLTADGNDLLINWRL